MPPKSAYHRNPRPAFKPPRPVGTAPTGSFPVTPTVDGALLVSRAFESLPAEPFISSPDSTNHNILNEIQISDHDSSAPEDQTTSSNSLYRGGIPQKLLTKILHDNFKHDDTRITKEAMVLFVKYADTFAAEAIARAIAERRETVKGKSASDISDDFLQVEDLEKLAPQLLLDF